VKKERLTQLVPIERIERLIHLARGEKVLLDADLAKLYGVETKALNRAVRRNRCRFPEDFMFQLTTDEVADLRCQTGTSSSGYGGRRYLPYGSDRHAGNLCAGISLNGVGGEFGDSERDFPAAITNSKCSMLNAQMKSSI